ncbi:beta-N-acetylhexosaminidase [Prevotella sp. P6B1]|uniref:beta-N-acetylhexosaminidase n=1 Tax=Prevotella sp. P6B1 TaxID=1410613 RepID=UPI00068AF59C|nr:beta-N-acetylhexosaminidase [Prevotella sp. P6B1]
MNFNLKPLVLTALFAIHSSLFTSAAPADYHVVPLPQSIQLAKGPAFLLDADVQILAPAELQREAALLQQYLKEVAGLQLPITDKRAKKMRYIELGISTKVTNQEGYMLNVSQKGFRIEGGSAAGVFYGIQTLRKAAANGTEFAAATITDTPRFSWRGMHLDCSRHFFSVDFVKKYIDLLAMHNMNVFHWHLTDDQGWRIEIKKYPKLTTIGSQRSGTVLGINADLDDSIPHGGYYTQQQAREIVEYAQERHITVVPEIDMPGHMLAALACYPELGCTGGPYQVGHYWGVYKDVLCVGNPKVYEFVEDVLTEIMDIFPSEVIHIGGDEAPTEKWEHCAKCNSLNLKHTTYQGFFTKRVFDFITAHHRRVLGWDEILEASPADAMIMSWRGSAPGSQAAQTGHDVVMSPTSHCYFDYQQSKETSHEPSRCSGYIPVEKVYALDPAPDSIPADARKHILGGQANIWTEHLFTEGMVEYQALPRMSALAEVLWTMPEHKNFETFKERLTVFTRLYELYHYQYAKHLWPDRQLPSRWLF